MLSHFPFTLSSEIQLTEDNSTICTTYIPGIREYSEALGWIWILFLVIGCSTCALLYTLFVRQLVSSFEDVHVVFRNCVIWIASVYPFMTLMTLIGFAIPRSQQVCYTVKVMYMMIGISKFADFTILLYGSEEVMLWRLKEAKLKLRLGPLCCCLFGLPRLTLSKRKLRLIIAGVSQLPFTQAFFLVSVMILVSANQVAVGSLNPKGIYVWLNLINVITNLLGVYCLNLLSSASNEFLHQYSYNKLSFVMRALIIVTKMQSTLFNTLAYYEIFPCLPPISPNVYRETVENFFYVIEMLVFGIYSFQLYSRTPLISANPTVVITDACGNSLPHHAAYLPSMTSYLPQDYGYGFPGSDFRNVGEIFDDERVDSEVLADAYRVNHDFSNVTLSIIGEDERTNNGYQRFH